MATIKVSKTIAAAVKEQEEKDREAARLSEFIPHEGGGPNVQGITSSVG